ncbi:hypothetical protein F4802DRAFT_239954 [Xylaria palmicola]|nr:hypothetical protein F4802DRAFT_239954 [Xylaria palmicola]
MADTALPPTATPKRKRDDAVAMRPSPVLYDAKTMFSFQPLQVQPFARADGPVEDGSASPQSRVAQKFRHLTIRESDEGLDGTGAGSPPESGGGATASTAGAAGAATSILHRAGIFRLSGREISAAPDTRFDFDAGTAAAPVDMQLDSDDDGGAVARKRPKTTAPDIISAEPATNGAAAEASDLTAPAIPDGGRVEDFPRLSVESDIRSTHDAGDATGSQVPSASTNYPADAKPRSRRRRVGTPPLSSRRKGKGHSKSDKEDEKDEDIVFVDPIRAALTWREDEITVYDPEDKDDDGTGINGIGFKPTAAVAYHRAQKRRQQLAEYKKREENEARARRNQRRREPLGGGAEMVRKHSIVRVHFSDAPPTTVMTT